jgi:hypothetical protein
MTTGQLKELQEMTAKFLGWEIMPYTEGNCYSHPSHPCDVRVLEDFDLEDWNFIHEVVDAIEKRGFDVFINTCVCRITDVGEGIFEDIESFSDSNKKEAVIQAIYEFIKWYQGINKSN